MWGWGKQPKRGLSLPEHTEGSSLKCQMAREGNAAFKVKKKKKKNVFLVRSNTADTPEVEIGWDFCQVPVRERLPFKLERLLQGVTDTPVTLLETFGLPRYVCEFSLNPREGLAEQWVTQYKPHSGLGYNLFPWSGHTPWTKSTSQDKFEGRSVSLSMDQA